jgi:hypothetical protein
LPATFYVVKRTPHLFFSHSATGTCFFESLRHQRDEKSRRDCAVASQGTIGSPRDYRKLRGEAHALRSAGVTWGLAYFFPYFSFKE